VGRGDGEVEAPIDMFIYIIFTNRKIKGLRGERGNKKKRFENDEICEDVGNRKA
jgi:hypothetical protein